MEVGGRSRAAVVANRTESMDQAVADVRSRVQQMIAGQDQQLFDEQDIQRHVSSRKQVGLINLFCSRYASQHRGSYDVDHISKRLVETLKWRRSMGISRMQASDFPLEMWQQNPSFVYESDSQLIMIYIMRADARISDKWSELRGRLAYFIHEHWLLSATTSGKQVIVISDTSQNGLQTDVRLHAKITRNIDQHFPGCVSKGAIYGLPWFLTSIASFFLRFTMPPAMSQVVRVYGKDTLHQLFSSPALMPSMLGGSLVLKSAVSRERDHLRSLEKNHADWQLQEWEVKKVMDSCSREYIIE